MDGGPREEGCETVSEQEEEEYGGVLGSFH